MNKHRMEIWYVLKKNELKNLMNIFVIFICSIIVDQIVIINWKYGLIINRRNNESSNDGASLGYEPAL